MLLSQKNFGKNKWGYFHPWGKTHHYFQPVYTLGIVKQPSNIYHFLLAGEVVHVLYASKNKDAVLEVQRISKPLKQVLNKKDLILC